MSEHRIISKDLPPSRPRVPAPPPPVPLGAALSQGLRRSATAALILAFGGDDAKLLVRRLLDGDMEPDEASSFRERLDRVFGD